VQFDKVSNDPIIMDAGFACVLMQLSIDEAQVISHNVEFFTHFDTDNRSSTTLYQWLEVLLHVTIDGFFVIVSANNTGVVCGLVIFTHMILHVPLSRVCSPAHISVKNLDIRNAVKQLLFQHVTVLMLTKSTGALGLPLAAHTVSHTVGVNNAFE
jgi:hypothetical protein